MEPKFIGLMPTRVWSVPVLGSDENEFDMRVRIRPRTKRWPKVMEVWQTLDLFWEG